MIPMSIWGDMGASFEEGLVLYRDKRSWAKRFIMMRRCAKKAGLLALSAF